MSLIKGLLTKWNLQRVCAVSAIVGSHLHGRCSQSVESWHRGRAFSGIHLLLVFAVSMINGEIVAIAVGAGVLMLATFGHRDVRLLARL